MTVTALDYNVNEIPEGPGVVLVVLVDVDVVDTVVVVVDDADTVHCAIPMRFVVGCVICGTSITKE